MQILPLVIVLTLFSKDRNREWPSQVTLNCEDVPIREILAEIRRQTGIRVEMDEAATAALDPSTKLSLKVSEISVDSTLRLLLLPRASRLNIIWKKDRRNVLISVCRLAERER
ncbi:MAG TPA: hypothetical protein VNM14_14745 [Planctomycetota bacterium]|nr:hypothetical protein [Planctomycetota bacterium]